MEPARTELRTERRPERRSVSRATRWNASAFSARSLLRKVDAPRNRVPIPTATRTELPREDSRRTALHVQTSTGTARPRHGADVAPGASGEARWDCGGCHAHSQQPLAFEQTHAANAGYAPVDLTRTTPLLTQDAPSHSRVAGRRCGVLPRHPSDPDSEAARRLPRDRAHRGEPRARRHVDHGNGLPGLSPPRRRYRRAVGHPPSSRTAPGGDECEPLHPPLPESAEACSCGRSSVRASTVDDASSDGDAPGDAETLPSGANPNEADLDTRATRCRHRAAASPAHDGREDGDRALDRSRRADSLGDDGARPSGGVPRRDPADARLDLHSRAAIRRRSQRSASASPTRTGVAAARCGSPPTSPSPAARRARAADRAVAMGDDVGADHARSALTEIGERHVYAHVADLQGKRDARRPTLLRRQSAGAAALGGCPATPATGCTVGQTGVSMCAAASDGSSTGSGQAARRLRFRRSLGGVRRTPCAYDGTGALVTEVGAQPTALRERPCWRRLRAVACATRRPRGCRGVSRPCSARLPSPLP